MKQLKELPMEKVGTEELTVRGKDVSCAGYRITVDDQFLRDLTEAAAVRPTDDVQQAIRTLTGQDPEDLIGSYSDIYMDPMSSSFTADITFYVGKGRVAAVECVTGGENYRLEFRGEDIPWYDTRLLVSGTDTGVRMLVTDSGDSENVRIEADGEAIDLVYGKTAHDYEVRYAGVSMARGTLESRGDDFTFTMEPSGAKELIGDLSVRFDLYDDASLDQISGTPLDISQASEEDIYSLMEGIDDLGDLF